MYALWKHAGCGNESWVSWDQMFDIYSAIIINLWSEDSADVNVAIKKQALIGDNHVSLVIRAISKMKTDAACELVSVFKCDI